MATASKVFKDAVINLEMSALEAAALMVVLRNVSGYQDTLRTPACNVGDALEELFGYNDFDVYPIFDEMEKSIDNEDDADPKDEIHFNALDMTTLEDELQTYLANQ